mmetsp:Transcript_44390/g.105138  ORF Transcript_44390/g.105138 Transcript_44390/m.105138 type:complete len:348 (-) Transcript_44390:125-1168(-)
MVDEMLVALDGGVARLVAGFVDRSSLCSAFAITCRSIFSASTCQPQVCRTWLQEWRTAAIASMFEQDKRLSRAVSWVECMILVRHGDAIAEDEGIAADGFEGMALRSQIVAALERAVSAASQHADKCAEVNAVLLNQANHLSRLLSWLKLQRRRYLQESCGTAPQQIHASMRLESCRQESMELKQRLALLLRASSTFVTLVAGCGGAVERHQRLVKVLRLAQLARRNGLGSGVEEECDRIHDAWMHAARKLDAVVCSLHMRCEAFAQVAHAWGFHEMGAASCLDTVASTDKRRRGSQQLFASGSEPSVAKLSVLNAIASSTAQSSANAAAADECCIRQDGSDLGIGC